MFFYLNVFILTGIFILMIWKGVFALSVDKTREIICSSFLELTEKKKINDITITALCKKAGIARTTFYAHYDNIYDVVLSLQNNYLSGMEKIINKNRKDDIVIDEVVEYVFMNYRIPRLFLVEQPDDLFAERYKAAAQRYLSDANEQLIISEMKLSLIADMCRYYLNHIETFSKRTMEEHVDLIDAILKQR